jgi:hypothetical protein
MVSNLIRVSILGALPNGEEWTVNPVWRINGPGQEVTVAKLTTIAASINAITVPTAVRNLMTPSTTINGVRLEARANDGQLMAQAEGLRGVALVGSGGQAHPYQTSIVTSLRTPGPGASGRGRLYWPATGATVGATTLRMSSADVTSTLAGVKGYLQLIESAITAQVTDCILAVWSRKLNTTFGVTSLLEGDIYDTQRRRRDVLVETYQQLLYP